MGEDRDDERTGTKYNVRIQVSSGEELSPYNFLQYSWFHVIFIMAAMYVSGLLTDWYVHAHEVWLGCL